MGFSSKSHGKKSDKETQSPVLKLFKDMMQKEKHDPEKTNLLKTKTEKKKKKHSGSRSKSDRKTMDSSCSEHRSAPYRGNQELRNAALDPARTISTGESSPEKPPSDDTRSCVSCALKKIINTDYACIGCLVLLFTISVVVAFVLIYKSIPCFSDQTGSMKVDTERTKRKIDGQSRLRWDHLGKRTLEGKKWDNGETNYGVPPSMEFHDVNSLVDASSDLAKILDSDMMSEIKNSDRLREFYIKLIKTDAQIQDLKKNNEGGANDIDIEDKYKTYPERAKRSLSIFHKPRKLFLFKNHKKGKGTKITDKKYEVVTADNKDADIIKSKEETKATDTPIKNSIKKNLKVSRNKRLDNTSEPKGFLFEKKNVLVQYKPNHKNINRIYKCSHAPKDSKSHENQLKHPFYQNTQRLDELLDKFFDKNLPEILADQFGLDMIFAKEKEKCKHPAIQVETPLTKQTTLERMTEKNPITQKKDQLKFDEKVFSLENDFTKIYRPEISTAQNYMFGELGFGNDERKREDTTTNDYGLLLSVSTMMYDGNIKRTTYAPNFLLNRVPNARKLLQTDKDDDMNEVVVKTHDIANQENRKKRMDEPTLEDTTTNQKISPVSILSPNWKGPMPLYPDELTSMIRQTPVIVNSVSAPVYKYDSDEETIAVKKTAIPELNPAFEKDDNVAYRVKTPIRKDSPSETDEFEADLNDMEYIEDYFRSKYDRLVELAQAYSDYGVLDGKKIATEKKVDDKIKLSGPDHRLKLSLSGFKEGFKSSIFGRPKKGSHNLRNPSEGFRLELQPTSSSREDNPLHFIKSLQKHVKVADFKPIQSTPIPMPEIDLIYTLREDNLKTTKKIKQGSENEHHAFAFSVGKGKRTLKSVEFTETFSETIPHENKEHDDIHSDQNIRNAFDNIHKRDVDNSNVLADDNNLTSNVKLGIADEFERNSTKKSGSNDEVTKSNTKLTSGDALRSIDKHFSDFFMMLSSWFSALNGVDINFSRNLTGNSSFSPPNNTHTKQINETDELVYPAYDSEIIENIGHRSRVLLAVEYSNDTVKIGHTDVIDGGITKAIDSSNVNANTTISQQKAINLKANKTNIVKRNADSNLIFWNDLYDDEYGVAVDHLENNIRDKHSIEKTDFIKRPKLWFRDKVKMMADRFHKKAESLRKGSKTKALKFRKEKNKEEAEIKSTSKEAIYKRISRDTIEDEPSLTKKTDFAALTAKMKKICRKAAKDIEQANRVGVREVSKDGQVASSLMQQLVRLMGDLVDYQVKQRTCRKLTPDLQTFLEWLTSSSSEPEPDKYSSKIDEYPNIDFGKVFDKSEERSMGMSSSERDTSTPVSRSDCLGTLQAVQALMQQFEDMGEDDKSKMFGVKEYLESQLQYLQKQVPLVYDYNLYKIDSARYRREVSTQTTPKAHRPKKSKRKLRQMFRNFVKTFAKKHTEGTTINNMGIKKVNQDTIVDESKKTIDMKVNKDKINGLKTVKEKRNLRDVYYKALADAKKLTTIKNHVLFT